MNVLKNKVEAINEINAIANEVMPKIIALFKVGVKVKLDGTLYERDAEKYLNIVKDHVNQKITLYIKIRGENVWFHFKTYYYVSEHTVDYYQGTKWLCYRDGERKEQQPLSLLRADYTEKEVQEAQIKLEKIKDEIEVKKNELHALHYAYDGLLRG